VVPQTIHSNQAVQRRFIQQQMCVGFEMRYVTMVISFCSPCRQNIRKQRVIQAPGGLDPVVPQTIHFNQAVQRRFIQQQMCVGFEMRYVKMVISFCRPVRHIGGQKGIGMKTLILTVLVVGLVVGFGVLHVNLF